MNMLILTIYHLLDVQQPEPPSHLYVGHETMGLPVADVWEPKPHGQSTGMYATSEQLPTKYAATSNDVYTPEG